MKTNTSIIMKTTTTLLFFLSLIICAQAQNNLLSSAQTGNIITNGQVDNFTFAYDGTDLTLMVASNATSSIYAIDWNGSTDIGVVDFGLQPIPTIVAKIAALMGVTSTSLTIDNMEVNPKTKAAYILVSQNTGNNWGLFEVKNDNDISLVSFNNVTFSEIEFTVNNNQINDLSWGADNKLYFCTGDFTLDAEVGAIDAPFTHNTTASSRATSMFKSNWGGGFFTSAPLEHISFSEVDGTNRIMGVTTCAPGFSIPATDINGSANLLQVTEDFNINFSPSLKVVTVTQVDNGGTNSYLFDLHTNFINGPQLIRVGQKYLDGSRAAANEINVDAQEIRDFNGDITAGLLDEDAKEIGSGFKMIAKFSEYDLLVVDDTETLRMLSVGIDPGTPPTSVLENTDQPNIRVFPNPTSDRLFIDGLQISEQYSYQLYDLTGKSVNDGNLSTSGISVDQIAPGTYLLTIQKGSEVISTDQILIH